MVVPYPRVWSLHVRNVQQRIINAPTEMVGAVLDSASGPADRLWPAGWPPLRLDDGLTIGSHGGHGPIRYSVSEYEPGRRIRFVPDADIGLKGYHEFTVTPEGSDRSLVRHVIDARLRGRMILAWPIAIRWVHEAVLHDLLDTVERNSTGRLAGEPARWSAWVRLLRRAFRPPGANLSR